MVVDFPARIKQVVLPLRQRVLARGEPFVTYINMGYSSGTAPAHFRGNPQEYSEFAEALLLWLQNRNPNPENFNPPFVPTYYSVYNEPDSHGFTAAEVAANAQALGARLAAMGLATRVQVAEAATPNSGYTSNVLNVAGVSQFVGSISFHGYDYRDQSMPASFATRNALRNLARNLGLKTAMTEICCWNGWKGNYDHGLAWARDIYWNMTEADISDWEPFGLMNPCGAAACAGGGEAVILFDVDLSRSFKLAVYYAVRQYSRYVRPGFVRVGTTCANCGTDPNLGQVVKPVAFRTPTGKYVVVVLNDAAAPQSISLTGFPAGTYDISGVDPANATSPVSYTSQTIAAGESITVTFPGQAILTFVQR
jgi:O-glycosyl hydrolase